MTKEAAEYINEIFSRMQAICPAWKQAFSSTEELNLAKQEWTIGFYDSGVKSKQAVDYGLNKLRQSGNPFIPPVGQFIDWCRDGIMPAGTKNALESYKEVCAYQCLPCEKRQPCTLSQESWHTLNNLGDLPNWRQMEKIKHKKYWDDEHERTLERLRNGQTLDSVPEPRESIEHKRKPLDKQKAISALQQMREGLK